MVMKRFCAIAAILSAIATPGRAQELPLPDDDRQTVTNALAALATPGRTQGRPSADDIKAVANALVALSMMSTVASCSALYPSGSWIEPGLAEDAAAPIAHAIVDAVRRRSPPPATVALEPLPDAQEQSFLAGVLDQELRAAGYTLVSANAPDARRLRYFVSSHGAEGVEIVWRIWFDGASANAMVVRGQGQEGFVASPILAWEVRR
jgi:hypothetical protein